MVGTRSLSSGARSRDPLALPTLQSNGIARRVPSRAALNGTDLPSHVMKPNARDPNNQGSLCKPNGGISATLWSDFMRITSCVIAAAAMFAATAASAQTVNLTGTYRCIEGCKAAPLGSPAFVTQN